MESVLSRFNSYPSQRDVVAVMLRNGISVNKGKPCCGGIEISDTALANASKVDRRVVRSTMDRISSDPFLCDFFSDYRCTALLSEVAPMIGCTALEIVPDDASRPGLISIITGVIADAGVSLRQAVVEEQDGEQSHLILVLDGQLPSQYLPKIRSLDGVKSLIIK